MTEPPGGIYHLQLKSVIESNSKTGIVPYAATDLNACKRREKSTTRIINRYQSNNIVHGEDHMWGMVAHISDTVYYFQLDDHCNDQH